MSPIELIGRLESAACDAIRNWRGGIGTVEAYSYRDIASEVYLKLYSVGKADYNYTQRSLYLMCMRWIIDHTVKLKNSSCMVDVGGVLPDVMDEDSPECFTIEDVKRRLETGNVANISCIHHYRGALNSSKSQFHRMADYIDPNVLQLVKGSTC